MTSNPKFNIRTAADSGVDRVRAHIEAAQAEPGGLCGEPEMSNDRSLVKRLEFMKLGPSSLAQLRSLRPLIEKELPAALDVFYEQVKQFPEVARFFSDANQLGKAKGAQLRHW